MSSLSGVGYLTPDPLRIGGAARLRCRGLTMALIDSVRAICADLAADGWRDLLKVHGLDIRRADLAVALREPLTIDRTLSGFEDFPEMVCGASSQAIPIEACCCTRSPPRE